MKKLRPVKEIPLKEQTINLNPNQGLYVLPKGSCLMIERFDEPLEDVNTIEKFLTQKWYYEVHYKLKEKLNSNTKF